MSRWFRFYDMTLDEPKVQRLSDSAFRTWVNLLCVASRNGGLIPGDISDIAFSLRIPQGKARDLIQVLLSAELIDPVDGEGWEPHNWKSRQYESDSAAERMRRHRDKKKASPVTGNVTSLLRHPLRNSDGIEQNRTEQIQNRTEQSAASPLDCCFVDFFQAMPRRIGEKAARAAYEIAAPIATPDVLLAAAKAYAVKVRGYEEKHVLSPAAWLEKERWTDQDFSASPPKKTAFNNPDELAAQERAKEKYLGEKAH